MTASEPQGVGIMIRKSMREQVGRKLTEFHHRLSTGAMTPAQQTSLIRPYEDIFDRL